MVLNNKRITIFTGYFGSGKTEIALNYAVDLYAKYCQTAGVLPDPEVTLIDLDLVNPYFRSQEAKDILEEKGIKVIAPPEAMRGSDLPVMVSEAFEAFARQKGLLVVDVGGDDQGALALGQFRQWLKEGGYEFWLVVNPYRPFNEDVAGIAATCQRIEAASRLRLTGLVSNPNLGRETTPEVIVEGHQVVLRASEELGLPVKALVVHETVASRWCEAEFSSEGVPVLSIKTFLYPEWLDD
jgi:hypothetical protein